MKIKFLWLILLFIVFCAVFIILVISSTLINTSAKAQSCTDKSDDLLSILDGIVAMKNSTNRDRLLENFPEHLRTQVPRDTAINTDLWNIVTFAEAWEWIPSQEKFALVIVAESALPFAQDTIDEMRINAVINEINTCPTPPTSSNIAKATITSTLTLSAPTTEILTATSISTNISTIATANIILPTITDTTPITNPTPTPIPSTETLLPTTISIPNDTPTSPSISTSSPPDTPGPTRKVTADTFSQSQELTIIPQNINLIQSGNRSETVLQDYSKEDGVKELLQRFEKITIRLSEGKVDYVDSIIPNRNRRSIPIIEGDSQFSMDIYHPDKTDSLDAGIRFYLEGDTVIRAVIMTEGAGGDSNGNGTESNNGRPCTGCGGTSSYNRKNLVRN